MVKLLSEPLFVIGFLATWVAAGTSAVVYLGRHGHRSPAWFVLGVALGPILVPIALEVAERRNVLLTEPQARKDVSAARLRVLVAADGSLEAGVALTEAARVLPAQGTQFILLTVMDPDLGESDEVALRDAEHLLDSFARRLPEGCLPEVREVTSGDPATCVLDRAQAHRVDLIVLGRRGTGLSELLLGSVADKVVRRSPHPVLLGPERPTREH